MKIKTNKGKLKSISNLTGLKVKSKDGIVLLTDKDLIEEYSIKQIERKLKQCYKKIYNFLLDDNSTESGVKACLGEIEKLKSSLFIKYKEYIKKETYKKYITKIAIIENEFKNKYYEKAYFTKMVEELYRNSLYEEEYINGKSR